MHKYLAAAMSLAIVCALAACGGRGAGSTAPSSAFVPWNGMEVSFALPKNTIGEEEPSEGVGTKNDPTWGTVGGFTQTTKAQVLTFPLNTKVTIRNLSHSLPHTLNVISAGAKPPAQFPANPSFTFSPRGNGKIGATYASGAINSGASVKVVMAKAGKYLIGCAFHYSSGMKDVLIVKK